MIYMLRYVYVCNNVIYVIEGINCIVNGFKVCFIGRNLCLVLLIFVKNLCLGSL